MEMIYFVAWIFIAPLVMVIMDNLVGFHISKYTLFQAIIINLSRIFAGVILALILWR